MQKKHASFLPQTKDKKKIKNDAKTITRLGLSK